jgi:hypothetical protein
MKKAINKISRDAIDVKDNPSREADVDLSRPPGWPPDWPPPATFLRGAKIGADPSSNDVNEESPKPIAPLGPPSEESTTSKDDKSPHDAGPEEAAQQ